MRLIGRIRFLVVLIVTLIAFHNSNQSVMCYESLFEMSEFGVTSFKTEPLIRAQSRYSQYLRSYGIWGNLYGYEGRLRPHSSVFDKLKNSDTGMQFGIDLPSNDIFSTCLYYSYSSPSQHVMSSPVPILLDGKLGATNHLFGLRWKREGDGLYMLFGINGGFDKYDFHLADADTLSGGGWQFGGNVEFGLDVDEMAKWRLRPHLTFDYRWLHHENIDNRQRTFLFEESTCSALYSNLGLRVFRPLGPILEWQTRFSWLHNYLKSNDPIRVQRFGTISGLTTPTQLFLDGNLGRDWLWFGTGLKLHFGNFFSFYVDYDLTFNKYETTHTGSLMAILAW